MIYFIQRPEGGPIKIGTAIAVSRRLADLSRQHKTALVVLAVMKGGQKIEAYLHKQFALLRTEGEWFRPEPRLASFIARHGKEWDATDPSSNGIPRRTPFTMSLDQEVLEWLKAIEQETGARPSAVVNRIVLAWLREHPGFELPLPPQEA